MQIDSDIQSVAIIGGGPAGSSLACYLRQMQKQVTVFHDEKRPEIIVGESLIPAVIPLLRTLGVEEVVARHSIRKPGAILHVLESAMQWELHFSSLENESADYAYNVPRDVFDSILKERALELGATFVHKRVKTEYFPDNDSIAIDAEGSFDLIVDASGRQRNIARQLPHAAVQGKRNDIALFAHFAPKQLPFPGYLHIIAFAGGWAWLIPLPDRLSIGVVAPESYWKQFGTSAQEQLDAVLSEDTSLRDAVGTVERLSSVARYNNYQLRSSRSYGKNWALAGDAAGFLDPIFSSGLFLSLFSARHLASAIEHGTWKGYQQELQEEYTLWQELIESFYDGSFFSLVRQAKRFDKNMMSQLETSQCVARLLSGYGSQERDILKAYRWILKFCCSIEAGPRASAGDSLSPAKNAEHSQLKS